MKSSQVISSTRLTTGDNKSPKIYSEEAVLFWIFLQIRLVVANSTVVANHNQLVMVLFSVKEGGPPSSTSLLPILEVKHSRNCWNRAGFCHF